MYKVYVKQKYILWLDMDLIPNHLNVVWIWTVFQKLMHLNTWAP